MLFDMQSDYPIGPIIDHFVRRFSEPKKLVRHQQTCPACGRTLVNTYHRDGVWKCRKCWDKEGGADDGV